MRNIQSKSSPFRDLLQNLTPTAIICLSILIILIVLAIAAPWVSPYQPTEILTDESYHLMSDSMLLGGDYLGRDIASRLIYGLQITLGVTFVVTVLAFFTGCLLGFLAAVLGGIFDTLLSRVIDALIALPAIMIALIVIASLGSSLPVLIVTLALIDSTRVFRIARALAMNIVASDYVEAARVRGEGLKWIIWHEILPNALGPLAAEFGIRFTYTILFMSALGFLGLGMQPPHADLGLLIRENMQGLLFGSYAPLYPALAISLITITINIFIDWYLQQLDSALPSEF
ncbi:MAG: ABC transporter permease [gamma proteobacterium symbiont of Taylorina sp.]|nr:ABC transporter permease [gamma proteobacterium symbiont of Taylorina sp.]